MRQKSPIYFPLTSWLSLTYIEVYSRYLTLVNPVRWFDIYGWKKSLNVIFDSFDPLCTLSELNTVLVLPKKELKHNANIQEIWLMKRVIYTFVEYFHYTTQEYHLILFGGT